MDGHCDAGASRCGGAVRSIGLVALVWFWERPLSLGNRPTVGSVTRSLATLSLLCPRCRRNLHTCLSHLG